MNREAIKKEYENMVELAKKLSGINFGVTGHLATMCKENELINKSQERFDALLSEYKQTKKQIRNLLEEYNPKKSIAGYERVVDAVCIIINSDEKLQMMSLYEAVVEIERLGKDPSSTASKVERSIRHFTQSLGIDTTNREFIYDIYYKYVNRED